MDWEGGVGCTGGIGGWSHSLESWGFDWWSCWWGGSKEHIEKVWIDIEY